MKPGLTPSETIILGAVELAAERGWECPTNTQFFEIYGCGISQGSQILGKLERKGLISVERGNSKRVVTILATGKKTAGTITNKHWRDRPENKPKVDARVGGRDQSKPRLQIEPTYVDRDPCFHCGSRKDACQCGAGGRAQ